MDDELDSSEESILDEKAESMFQKLKRFIDFSPMGKERTTKDFMRETTAEIESHHYSKSSLAILNKLYAKLEQYLTNSE